MGSFVNNLIGGTNNATASLPNIQKQDNLQQEINSANEFVQQNIGNQNEFAKALQTQMNGGGPNLAGSLLSNATGQNIANQAALMASQRNSGSNSGLIARQAAQQGAATQQQSAGQAAAIRQQQQLNAQQGLGNVYGQIGQQAGQNLSIQQQALANQNSAVNQATLGTNQINANIAGQNAAANSAVISGLGQAAIGGGAPKSAGAKGGEMTESGFSSPLDEHHQMLSNIYHPHMSSNTAYNASTNAYAKGGKVVDALVSPGEIRLKPNEAKKVAEGKADPEKVGEKIPGKPNVPGPVNSYANDNVRKKLNVGDIIVPRSETQSDTPKKDTKEFVKATIQKQINKKVKK